MIEYFFLFFSTVIFFLTITIPIKKLFFFKIADFKLNIFDYCTVNILFFSNTLILLAILKINISTIILVVCSLFILNILLF